MSTIQDILHTKRIYDGFYKVINGVYCEKDRSFLSIMLGWMDYQDGRRRIRSPEEFKTTYTYVAYQKHSRKFDDEFLKKYGIDI